MEVFFGDKDVPLFALGPEVLLSQDVRTCSPQDIRRANTNAFTLQTPLITSRSPPIVQSRATYEGLLLGFPLKALNKLMLMGAMVTGFSDHNNPYFQRHPYQQAFQDYFLRDLSAAIVKAKLMPSNKDDKACTLSLIFCPERLKCELRSLLQVPVLGISERHQALIVDPHDFGTYLEEKQYIYSIRPRPDQSTHIRPKRRLNAINSRTHLIAFDKSLLIFDVVSMMRWFGPDPRPDVTTRWFLKFNLVASEGGFQSRPPTEGAGYLLNRLPPRPLQARSNMPIRILRQRIFKDGQIRPVVWYVKNVPSKFYEEAIQKAFEYWQAIFISFIGHPVLSYVFIQGNFDGQHEIVTGDPRYNVIEWKYYRQNFEASTTQIFNPYTGEMLSSSIIILGSYIIDMYREWFEYSQFVRTSRSVEHWDISHAMFKKRFEDSYQAPYTQQRPLYSSIRLPLFPETETFESYIFGFITNLTAHEIGHSLGLAHNYKASLYADGNTAGVSQMDYSSRQDTHKPISAEYDKQTIGYSYFGIPLERTDMFCVDQTFPECNRYDLGDDPLENASRELRQIVDLLISRTHNHALPYLRWNNQVQDNVTHLLNMIISFYVFADTHYDQFESISIAGRKPNNPQEVKDMVIAILKTFLCDSKLNNILNLQGEYQHANPYDRQLQRNIELFFRWFKIYVLRRYEIEDIQCKGLD